MNFSLIDTLNLICYLVVGLACILIAAAFWNYKTQGYSEIINNWKDNGRHSK